MRRTVFAYLMLFAWLLTGCSNTAESVAELPTVMVLPSLTPTEETAALVPTDAPNSTSAPTSTESPTATTSNTPTDAPTSTPPLTSTGVPASPTTETDAAVISELSAVNVSLTETLDLNGLIVKYPSDWFVGFDRKTVFAVGDIDAGKLFLVTSGVDAPDSLVSLPLVSRILMGDAGLPVEHQAAIEFNFDNQPNLSPIDQLNNWIEANRELYVVAVGGTYEVNEPESTIIADRAAARASGSISFTTGVEYFNNIEILTVEMGDGNYFTLTLYAVPEEIENYKPVLVAIAESIVM